MINRRNIARAVGMVAAVALTAAALIASTSQGQDTVQGEASAGFSSVEG